MKESDSFYIINRKEWKDLNKDKKMMLTDTEVEALRSLNDNVSVMDVKEIYLPMLEIIDKYIKHYQERQDEIKDFLSKPHKRDPYIIGIAGSVAVGKSTCALSSDYVGTCVSRFES